MDQKNNTFIIAGAIIIAGFLVALGVFASKNPSDGERAATDQILAEREIDLRDITPTDHVRGNRDAEVVLVEFSDIECPFCQQFHSEVKAVQESFAPNEFAWVYRHFPLEQIHPRARAYAEATECAAQVGGPNAFWTYLDGIIAQAQTGSVADAGLTTLATSLGINAQAFNTCIAGTSKDAVITEGTNDALAAGGEGTPFNVFVLKTALSDETRTELETVIAQPGFASVSPDGTKIAIGGGLPRETLTEIVNVLLGK